MRSLSVSTGTCSSWGGSNYITFDGTSYSFRGNCTYVLMREIRPLHGNLTILLYKQYCPAAVASTSCPIALSIHYKSTEVILATTTAAGGQEEGLVSAVPSTAWGRPRPRASGAAALGGGLPAEDGPNPTDGSSNTPPGPV